MTGYLPLPIHEIHPLLASCYGCRICFGCGLDMAPSTCLTSSTRTHGISCKMASSSFRIFNGGQMQATYLQKTVLAVPLQPQALQYVKNIVLHNAPLGVFNDGLTLDGK